MRDVPDDLDYQALKALLDDPEAWTAEQAASAQLLLRGQRDALRTVHPKDQRLRERMQSVVEEIERAIQRWEGAR